MLYVVTLAVLALSPLVLYNLKIIPHPATKRRTLQGALGMWTSFGMLNCIYAAFNVAINHDVNVLERIVAVPTVFHFELDVLNIAIIALCTIALYVRD